MNITPQLGSLLFAKTILQSLTYYTDWRISADVDTESKLCSGVK